MPSKVKKTFSYEGIRYQVCGKTEKEVYEKMALKKLALKNGELVPNSNTTVEKWAYKCVELYKQNQKANTRKAYISTLKCCVLNEIGKRKLQSIKPYELQELLNYQSDKSRAHIERVYGQLRLIFGRAVDNGLMSSDPTKNLVKPRGYTNTRRAITPEERERIVRVAQQPKYNIFLLMLYCGLRPIEAMNVECEDFYMAKSPMLHVRGTKTKNADRNVPCKKFFYDLAQERSGLMFPNTFGGKYNGETIRKLWSKFKKEAEIEGLTPYNLRHSYITSLALSGVDIRICSKLAGHSSIKITADIYTHLNIEEIDIANIIEAM